MAGKRYSEDEISQVQALIDEGLTNKEIATQLGRSEAGIRNIRYREGLRNKAKNQTRILLQQKDRLRFQIPELQRKHTELIDTIDLLEKRRSRVEGILKVDRSLLKLALARSCMHQPSLRNAILEGA